MESVRGIAWAIRIRQADITDTDTMPTWRKTQPAVRFE
jgi:hypothetical protein